MKFKQGDRVRHIDTGWVGSVIGVDSYGSCNILVLYDENEEIKGDDEYYVRAEDIEFVDKRRAFLERLQALLQDFDAEIGIHYGSTFDGMPHGIMLTIDHTDNRNEDRLFYDAPLVDADDVFDYDK